MDVAAWLEGLGLERYAPAFRDNEIDWDALPKLTAEDLKDLGVVLGGHRRKLLHAIAALGAAVPAAAAMAAAPDALARAEAERRQLTVMFCDLVGSTPLSARLDPEDLRGIIGTYHRCVAETVEGFGGFVARHGRWCPNLFRLSAGARERRRARHALRVGAGRSCAAAEPGRRAPRAGRDCHRAGCRWRRGCRARCRRQCAQSRRAPAGLG